MCGFIREVRITAQTYYRWRKQYGGMGTDQLKEPKRLQKENQRLRRPVSISVVGLARSKSAPRSQDADAYEGLRLWPFGDPAQSA